MWLAADGNQRKQSISSLFLWGVKGGGTASAPQREENEKKIDWLELKDGRESEVKWTQRKAIGELI